MKKLLILSMISLFGIDAIGQNVTELDRQANIDWSEDSTEIMTVEDIVKTQQGLTSNQFEESHFKDVWSRKGYLNLSYNTTTLKPDETISTGVPSVNGGIVPELKSKWGVSLQLGRNYKLHKKPISNILQFYIDYQYIDLNLNFFEQEGNGKNLYDTSQKLPNNTSKFYIPWNLKKYEVNYGMALGPSITVAPFNNMSNKGLHYLQFNMWYNIGYHASLLLMKNDEDADINKGGYSNEDKVREGIKMNLGHGLTSAFGFSLTWKFIGIGYEYRSASLKYQSLDKDTYGDDKYKFKSSTSRVFLQFRLK